MRVTSFLAVLGILAASGYAAFDRTREGGVDPARQLSAAQAKLELQSARYALSVVAGQLAQVKVVTGTYADTLDFDAFPLVTLRQADEQSYCVEYEKVLTYHLRGPGGTVAQGAC